jgi:hypothetical protein
MRSAAIGLAAIALAGCTMGFGGRGNFDAHMSAWRLPAVKVQVCTNAPGRVASALPPEYGIHVEAVPAIAPERGGFTHGAIFDAVFKVWDQKACPRFLAVYQATAADHAWWVALGGVRGETGWTEDDKFMGFAFDTGDTVEHELLHVLGCKTHSMVECNQHLARIKKGEVK